ncbi:MAG: GNAT family N-acetyltransferase [Weeksellaceae bacterium]|nr:GNAT family N-acetyltransferase [Weeksellaceae bacterium]
MEDTKFSEKILHWQLKTFDELSNLDIYEVLRLRAEVFVVEQNAAYQDVDKIDIGSHHLLGMHHDQLVTYCRIIPPGQYFTEACLGRVVTREKYRKQGFSRKAVFLALQAIQNLYNTSECRISAQEYLIDFYTSFGFEVVSERYLEDGLPHFQMLKS